MAAPLEIALQFLEDFGFFNVVLPFLLVFTLVFALLEKTRILGADKDGNPKKNLDSMVAFVIALFVVISSQIVQVIRESLPIVVLGLIVLISFLLLVGSMMSGRNPFSLEDDKYKEWRIGFMIAMLIGVLLIFLGVIRDAAGKTWLSLVWDYTGANWMTGPVVSGIILVIILVLVIWFVTRSPEEKKSSGGSE